MSVDLCAAVAAACLAMTSVPQAQADEPAPRWQGVWQGTLGKADVRMCLQGAGPGAYYYEKYLKPIALEQQAPAASADEVALSETIYPARDSKATPQQASLRLHAEPAGRRLQGTWQLGGKALPLRLQRVPLPHADEDDGACGSDAFNAPREQPARAVEQPATVNGAAYRKLALDFGDRFDSQVVSFALVRKGAAAERINKAQRDGLHVTEQDVFDCSRSALAQRGWGGTLDSTTTPVLITAHWMITATQSDDDCGGAHLNSAVNYAVWNLDTGNAVDPWTWLGPAAVARPATDAGATPGDAAKIGPMLRHLLVKHWPRGDDDCTEVPTDNDDWMAYPARKGLVFVPSLPHVMMACTEDVVVPWPEMRPLLSQAGAKAVDAFLKDAAVPVSQ